MSQTPDLITKFGSDKNSKSIKEEKSLTRCVCRLIRCSHNWGEEL